MAATLRPSRPCLDERRSAEPLDAAPVLSSRECVEPSCHQAANGDTLEPAAAAWSNIFEVVEHHRLRAKTSERIDASLWSGGSLRVDRLNRRGRYADGGSSSTGAGTQCQKTCKRRSRVDHPRRASAASRIRCALAKSRSRAARASTASARRLLIEHGVEPRERAVETVHWADTPKSERRSLCANISKALTHSDTERPASNSLASTPPGDLDAARAMSRARNSRLSSTDSFPAAKHRSQRSTIAFNSGSSK